MIGYVTNAWRERDGWRFTIRYDQSVINALKESVPMTDRSYRESDHSWWVNESYQDALLTLFPNMESYMS